jgi:hypothetical protein
MNGIRVHRHPKNNYRLFAVVDLERIRKEIQATGTYPSGWQRPKHPGEKIVRSGAKVSIVRQASQ